MTDDLHEEILAIVLNWNSSSDTLACVRSVMSMHCVPDVLVVDNGSRRADVEAVEQALPQRATMIRLNANLGYAGGMNAGLRHAYARNYRWAWLLNADTAPDNQALCALWAPPEGARLIGSQQYAGTASLRDYYTVAADRTRFSLNPVRAPLVSPSWLPVDIVTGSALFLDVATAASLGYLDERFFHYKEEFDLAFRVSRRYPGSVFLCRDSHVWHRRGGSLPTDSSLATYYRYRNEVLFFRKHYPRWWVIFVPLNMRRMFLSIPRMPRQNARAAVSGVLDGMRNRMGERVDVFVSSGYEGRRRADRSG